MTSTSGSDLIDVITEDHRQVELVFEQLEDPRVEPGRRKELVDHVIAELVRHSVAEEQHVYPAARRHLHDGDEIADHEIAEHAEVERLMKRLEGLDATEPAFDSLVRELIDSIRHHVEEEERDLLPKLRAVCDEQELRELGEKVIEAKRTAPTRPHPAAPDMPPANRILDPGAGLVDRLRDKLTGREV
ncbi:hemerythrin domain-containing protein [Saccharomonospora xinjiangensis]|uniref:Hemerythrin HHE cation binding domain-containing protein n=1 Tax=Saccharomonospora xinjiangensis XJ-54 TaxID=882086 RepID=I0V7E0_9PSEU|nr:hemerythrin domain-containing protein [Saccharomonospora xinjiangensis]EID56043.1 hemerythrin HHE cation binding domain-containing protein [Saccharomonospora xinjiangensis XJ-54]